MRKLIDKPRAGGRWSEARFFGFLRSGLRRMSVRWPPKNDCMRASRRAYKGPNKRQKWEAQCSGCGQWFKLKEVKVHHIVPCGTLRCWADLAGFAQRLFCEAAGFRVLCVSCHEKVHADEKAKKEKKK